MGSCAMTNDNISDKYLKSGWPNNEVDRICNHVKRCVRNKLGLKRGFKIGMTAYPESRFETYLKESPNWRKMYVLYYTTSSCHQKQVERELIQTFSRKYSKKIENKRNGGAGRPPENSSLYVYVVVK